MKLSAPPPPPPEPPEQPAPEPTPPDPTAAVTPTEKPAVKPAAWPGWLGGADAAIALLSVVLAFLVASFAARNSDVWLHLGAGKKLTTGEYALGSDPFSYPGADRAWVNHSWLFDLGFYLLYSGTGFTLVLLKAVAVAAAAGLLLAIRRPNYPLWPWAACVTLFVLAAAPRLTLAPIVGSVLFLAATLFAVFKVPAKRLPVVVGVVFWCWANTDQWFFVGPLALALLLAGEFLQQSFLARSDDVRGEPLAALPPVPTLAKALAVGVVACMLNPHHVRVWELPFELVGTSVGKADQEIFQGLLLTPLDGLYSEKPYLGYNVNGLAYAVLLVAGGVALGFGVGRLRVAHLFLWLGFAALSLLSVYAIPFFAVVAVPLIAGQLNALSARVQLGARSSPGTRLLVLGSAGGRVMSLFILVGLCAAAWPGWLHPQPFDPAAARRVAWAVEPDPALAKATTQIGAWRASGELPADARGVLASIALGNYCAWFAPGEKVFINGRYGHHRRELADYTALRLALGLRTRDGPPDAREAADILARHKAEYLGFHDALRRGGPPATSMLWAGWDNWSGWYSDGRTSVFGWRASPRSQSPAFEKLRLNAVALAIGPDVTRLPVGKAQPIPRPREWEDDFTRPAKPIPPEVDEALGWLDYRQSRALAYDLQQTVGVSVFFQIPSPQGWTFHQSAVQFLATTGQVGRVPPRGDAFQMAPVLALRAARRAIAANPDHPDGYYALAQVFQDAALPMSESERQLALVTAYRQCLSRLPEPDDLRKQVREYGRKVTTASPTLVALRLVELHLNPSRDGQFRGIVLDEEPLRQLAGYPIQNQQRQVVAYRFLPLDMVRALLLRATEYAAVEQGGLDEAARSNLLDQIKGLTKAVEDQLRLRNDAFKREPAQGVKPADRFRRAREYELPGEAIAVIKSMKGEELVSEFKQDVVPALMQLVALELCSGRLEDAAADLAELKEVFEDFTRPADQQSRNAMRQVLRMLDYQKMVLEGDYAGAGTEQEGLFGRRAGTEGILADAARFKLNPKPFSALGVAWPVVPMLGATSPLDAVTTYWNGFMQQQTYTFFRDALAQKMQEDAHFYFRRGFLSLVEGDVPAAKERFRQARRAPPPDWSLPTITHSVADTYLRVMDAAEKK